MGRLSVNDLWITHFLWFDKIEHHEISAFNITLISAGHRAVGFHLIPYDLRIVILLIDKPHPIGRIRLPCKLNGFKSRVPYAWLQNQVLSILKDACSQSIDATPITHIISHADTFGGADNFSISQTFVRSFVAMFRSGLWGQYLFLLNNDPCQQNKRQRPRINYQQNNSSFHHLYLFEHKVPSFCKQVDGGILHRCH